MKNITRILGICLVMVLLNACSIILPVNASGAPMGKKEGTAKATIILGLYFGQDAGIQTAAKNGGITKVATVDVKRFNCLGIFQTVTTIVTGE